MVSKKEYADDKYEIEDRCRRVGQAVSDNQAQIDSINQRLRDNALTLSKALAELAQVQSRAKTEEGAVSRLHGEIKDLNRRDHEARVCRKAQDKRISRGERKRQELQDELDGAIRFAHDKSQIIRDLAKRITRLEGDSKTIQNGLLIERELTEKDIERSEAIDREQDRHLADRGYKRMRDPRGSFRPPADIFVVTTPHGGVATYETEARAQYSADMIEGSVVSKRRLIRGK